MRLLSSLKGLIRWARVTGSANNADQFSVQQVQYKGKTADCFMVFPYGIHANVPADALVLMFASEGNCENRAGIGWTPQQRPALEPGEVAVYHPTTGAIITLKQNGDIDVTSTTKISMNAPDIEMNADNINMNYTNAVASGTNFEVTGGITNNGTDIGENHTHGGVTTGAFSTGPVQ